MAITAALAADLALLSDALDQPGTELDGDITGTVLQLAAGVRSSVQSYLGLTVTIGSALDTNDERLPAITLQFTLLDADVEPRHVKASLQLPIPIPTDSRGPGRPTIAVTLYAATPGAFVDLTADLSFLTGLPLTDIALDQHHDLAAQPDITGLLNADSTIHQATGVLISRGRTRDQAHAELDALALGAGTDRHTEALRILDALTVTRPSGRPTAGLPDGQPT